MSYTPPLQLKNIRDMLKNMLVVLLFDISSVTVEKLIDYAYSKPSVEFMNWLMKIHRVDRGKYVGGTYSGEQTGPPKWSNPEFGVIRVYYSFTDRYGVSTGSLVLARLPLSVAPELGTLEFTILGGSTLKTSSVGTAEDINGASFGLAIIYKSGGSIARIDAYALIDAMENGDKPVVYEPVSAASATADNYDKTTHAIAVGGGTSSETVTVEKDTRVAIDVGSLIDTTVSADEVVVAYYAHIYSSQSIGEGTIDVSLNTMVEAI